MKNTINRKTLLKMLANSKPQIERRNTMPILQNVRVETVGQSLFIDSTNLEVSLSDGQPLKTVGDYINIVVDLKKFQDLVKFGTSEDVTLEQRNLIFVVDGSEVHECQPAEAWPSFPSDPDKDYQKINFFNLLTAVKHAVSNDETRYHLNGCFLENKAGELIAVATDGHRLAKATEQTKATAPLGFILPVKAVNQVLKVFGNSEVEFVDGEKCGAAWSDYVFFKTEDQVSSTFLIVRKINGRYPNYNQFIPRQFSHKIKINRAEILKAAKNMIPLTNKKSLQGKIEFTTNSVILENSTVDFTFEGTGKDRKEIRNENARPKVKSTVLCTVKGEVPPVGLNLKYLVEALSAVDSEEVTLRINDTLSPISIIGKTEELNLIVMPMRL